MLESKLLTNLIGQVVIVDTDSNNIFLGKLEEFDARFLSLSHVDAHEIGKASLSKERYAHEARLIGVRANRKLTIVPMSRIVSITRLDDINV